MAWSVPVELVGEYRRAPRGESIRIVLMVLSITGKHVATAG